MQQQHDFIRLYILHLKPRKAVSKLQYVLKHHLSNLTGAQIH